MQSDNVLLQVDLNEHIVDIELLYSDNITETHLMASTKSNNQWKMLLEEKLDMDLSIIQDSSYFPIHSQYRTVYHYGRSIEECPEMFHPKRFFQFPEHIHLSPQQARGSSFIAAHDFKSNLYKIYGSGVDEGVLFMYKLPPGVDRVLYTDKLLFTSSYTAGRGTLQVLANQLAEISTEDFQEFPVHGVVQTFDLDIDERILCMYKKSIPHHYHDRKHYKHSASSEGQGQHGNDMTYTEGEGQTCPDGEGQSDCDFTCPEGEGDCDITYRRHTVFDGCIVITTKAVYECRPRISPERLYVSLCHRTVPVTQLESLAILTGVDLAYLTIQVAQSKLQCKQYGYANKLLNLAKCSRVQRCLLYAKYNLLEAAIDLGLDILTSGQALTTATDSTAVESGDSLTTATKKTVLTSGQSLTTAKNKSAVDSGQSLTAVTKKTIVDMCVKACILQMLRSQNQQHYVNVLRDLLLSQKDVLDSQIWSYLHRNNLYDVMWSVAAASGEIHQVVQLYINNRCLTLNSSITANLDHTYTKWIRKHKGSLLDYLTGNDVLVLLLNSPTTLTQLFDLMEEELPNMECHELSQLSEILNPGQKNVNHFLEGVLKHKEILTSTPAWDKAVDLCMLFMLSRIHDHVTDSQEVTDTSLADGETPYTVLVCRPSLLSCSTYVTAIIVDKTLYMWGRTGGGSVLKDSKCREVRMPGNAVVISISCGYTHILVLTHQGLYSFGSNKFGELGLGNRHVWEEPQLIDSLKEESVAQTACGQYHSLTLTEHGRVFSWGWGVHGQLGQGCAEDMLLPVEVSSLSSHFVVNIAAGQAHSMVLTKQGDVYVFGCNTFGQLGLGDTVKRSLPVKVELLPGPVKLVATRYFHSVAVTNDNQIYQWGTSPAGLKQKITESKKLSKQRTAVREKKDHDLHLVPTTVARTTRITGSDFNVDQVSCGFDFSVVLTSCGQIYSWGKNQDGQLGIGVKHLKYEDKLVPVIKISSILVHQVQCGPDFVVAMDTHGDIWGWGRNDYGQLAVSLPESLVGLDQAFVFPVNIPVIGTSVEPSKRKLWEMEPISSNRLKLQKLRLHDNVDSNSVLMYLQGLCEFLNLHLVLCKAVQLENYWVSAAICDMDGRTCDGFTYRLRHYAVTQHEGDVQRKVAQAFTGSITSARKDKDQGNLFTKLVQQLFDWWMECSQSDVSQLEAILLPHLEELAVTIFIILSSSQQSALLPDFSPVFIQQLSNWVLNTILQQPNNRNHKQLTEKLKAVVLTGNHHQLLTNKVRVNVNEEKTWQDLLANQIAGNSEVWKQTAVEVTGDVIAAVTAVVGQGHRKEHKAPAKMADSDKAPANMADCDEVPAKMADCDEAPTRMADCDSWQNLQEDNEGDKFPVFVDNTDTVEENKLLFKGTETLEEEESMERNVTVGLIGRNIEKSSSVECDEGEDCKSSEVRDNEQVTHSQDTTSHISKDEMQTSPNSLKQNDSEILKESLNNGVDIAEDSVDVSAVTTVLVFSCGHVFSKSMFTEVLKAEVEWKEVMYCYYSRQGHKTLACPNCVHLTLRSI